MLLFLLACRCAPPEGTERVRFDRPVLQQVGGRFYGESEDALTPKAAFSVQERCPRLTSVDVRRANDVILEVTAEGRGFERVTRVTGALPDGSLADISFARDGGALIFPVACTACEVYLGIDAGGRTAACLGPGYSLRFVDRRVVQ